jgi:hypothetical protein
MKHANKRQRILRADPVHQVLSQEVLLKLIVEFLIPIDDPSNLLSATLVCKQWHAICQEMVPRLYCVLAEAKLEVMESIGDAYQLHYVHHLGVRSVKGYSVEGKCEKTGNLLYHLGPSNDVNRWELPKGCERLMFLCRSGGGISPFLPAAALRFFPDGRIDAPTVTVF